MAMHNGTVLIADDNELNRWLLSEQLQHWTNAVTLAKDGKEAWEHLQTERYALIFLDMNMPFMNGLELIEKIRNDENPNRSTPAIAVTAHAQNQLHQTLTAAGFNDCLIKPILLQHLRPLIERWLTDPAYYAGQIVKKTDFNREISQMLLNRLFDEIPEYLTAIENAIGKHDYQQAWQVAHKLHGAFSFYGFEDFLPLANDLEQNLLDQDGAKAEIQFRSIQTRFASLADRKAVILARAMEKASQDLNDSS